MARVLRAWLDWRPDDETEDENCEAEQALLDLTDVLHDRGFVSGVEPTEVGAALLARVEANERSGGGAS